VEWTSEVRDGVGGGGGGSGTWCECVRVCESVFVRVCARTCNLIKDQQIFITSYGKHLSPFTFSFQMTSNYYTRSADVVNNCLILSKPLKDKGVVYRREALAATRP
jgi:hypothetical protein